MHRRLWLSLAMLAMGASLLVAAAFAGAASSSPDSSEIRRGGTLRINSFGDVDHVDPALAYGTTSWWLEYATAAKLFNYPDAPGARGRRLVPEVASGFRVSSGGRVYTFFIRNGFRFSDGTRVTARNFQYAINRNLNKELQSPAAAFISDPHGANIVGAQAVNEGNARQARGVTVRGNRLIIRLTHQNPAFMSIMAMPFFQAQSTKLPLTREVVSVNDRNDLPSAGPYFFAFREPSRTITLRRNPFYRRGPGRTRPRNLDAVNMRIGVSIEGGFREVLANQADMGPIPPAETANLARQFGVNRGRFQVRPEVCVSYLAFNHDRPLFRNNVRLKKAVNFAIRRAAMVDVAGAFAGRPHDQILVPGMPGFRNANIYPLARPNLARARSLARGATREGRAIYFYFAGRTGPARMELNREDLRNIGIDIEPRQHRGFALYDAAGKRGADFDITQGGWCADYLDPYDFINVLLFGGFIQQENNVNIAYFNVPRYNRLMAAASRLRGPARLRAYGNLDINLMRNNPPWAPFSLINEITLFSNRVDTRSLVYHPTYSWSIPALALRRGA